MKTLADFKRKLKVGVKLHTTFHKSIGISESGKAGYEDRDMGIREVSIVQSNAFALKTQKEKGMVDSWCGYPKAKECIISDNSIEILEEDKSKVLTYTFVD